MIDLLIFVKGCGILTYAKCLAASDFKDGCDCFGLVPACGSLAISRLL